MAGVHGLLAFWIGGAGAKTEQRAVNSLLAPWIGGAGAKTEQGAVRSLLAPWIGGASAAQPPLDQGGVASMLAFWAGGAAAGIAVPPQPEQPPTHGGGLWSGRDRELRDKVQRDNDLILALVAAVLSGSLNN